MGRRMKITMDDGRTYVGLFAGQIQTSGGLMWRFTFANPTATAVLVEPYRCVETNEALSDRGPDLPPNPNRGRLGTGQVSQPPHQYLCKSLTRSDADLSDPSDQVSDIFRQARWSELRGSRTAVQTF
ncbi:hypothetical protein BV20DRAFT_204493 [Pilatotrama ljubarskyi]|nr:hypothetical protein BV20DRAFT_204493 [Pilatotrama ljubarskyi]